MAIVHRKLRDMGTYFEAQSYFNDTFDIVVADIIEAYDSDDNEDEDNRIRIAYIAQIDDDNYLIAYDDEKSVRGDLSTVLAEVPNLLKQVYDKN